LIQYLKSDNPAAHDLMGLMGSFSYEMIDSFEHFEPHVDDPLDYPDFVFLLPERYIVIEHEKNKTHYCLLGGALSTKDIDQFQGLLQHKRPALAFHKAKAVNIHSHTSDDEFEDQVKASKQYIHQGDIFQIVLSRRFTLPCPKPFKSFQCLANSHYAPYLFYFNASTHVLFGASPETCVNVTQTKDKTRTLSLYPIAGTKARGANHLGEIDPNEDIRQEASLRLSLKEQAEHMMLVDLARNDIARLSKPGSTKVTELAKINYLSKVMHLCSRVEGILQSDLDALHAYQGCMNMGTVTGAPKIKAAQLIREFEKEKRGPYGGSFGWIDANDQLDLALLIRAALVKNEVASVRAGAGIVADSDPKAEMTETLHKAKAILEAIAKSQLEVTHAT
jgi:anthranilate synthase component 1